MDSTYLTSGRAARRLGIAKGTLLRAMRRGEITPASRTPGGTFRFHIADVEAYARRLATPTREPCPPEQLPPASCAPPAGSAPPVEGRYQALVTALGQIIWTTPATGQVADDVPLAVLEGSLTAAMVVVVLTGPSQVGGVLAWTI